MTDDGLIAETNRLLARVVAIHEEQKAESALFLKESGEKFGTLTTEREETMKKRLEQEGLPPEAVEGSDEEWEKRREDATRKTRENIETLRRKNEAYQEEMLSELNTQSDLLRRIAGRLEA